MSSNSETIVHDARKEFELMLQHVQENVTESAYDTERNIFAGLLALGRQLLQLYFIAQGARISRTARETEQGESLPYHSEKNRTYFSIFGKLSVQRPYFYASGVGSASPLDEMLSLGEDQYSDLFREMAEYLDVEMAYEKVSGLLQRFWDIDVGKQALQQLVVKDAEAVEAYYEQKPAPPIAEEGEILVVQSDGKGVPMVKSTDAVDKVRLGKGEKRSKKQEATVTSVYTIAANPRTPEDVVARLFREGTTEQVGEDGREKEKSTQVRVHPRHKEVWATLKGKDEALRRLQVRTQKRDGAHIVARVALTDGAKGLQQRMETFFPDFILILDFIHANEYLWDVANRLFSEGDPQREAWMRQRTLALLSGHADQIIVELRALADETNRSKAQQEQLRKTANYFERNLPRMRYDHYLAQGWPIASGVIEGACRHLVKDRCEQTGMRWTEQGDESLLQLRAVAENNDWSSYHAFRRQRRHLRLYGGAQPSPQPPELAALDEGKSRPRIVNFQRTRSHLVASTSPARMAA